MDLEGTVITNIREVRIKEYMKERAAEREIDMKKAYKDVEQRYDEGNTVINFVFQGYVRAIETDGKRTLADLKILTYLFSLLDVEKDDPRVMELEKDWNFTYTPMPHVDSSLLAQADSDEENRQEEERSEENIQEPVRQEQVLAIDDAIGTRRRYKQRTGDTKKQKLEKTRSKKGSSLEKKANEAVLPTGPFKVLLVVDMYSQGNKMKQYLEQSYPGQVWFDQGGAVSLCERYSELNFSIAILDMGIDNARNILEKITPQHPVIGIYERESHKGPEKGYDYLFRINSLIEGVDIGAPRTKAERDAYKETIDLLIKRYGQSDV